MGETALKIRTITLDLWGTLLLDGPASDNRYKKRRMADFETILRATGVRVSAAALDRAYDQSGAYLARVWSRHRDVPVDGHVRAVLAALDPRLPDRLTAEITSMLVDAYARPALLVPPAVDGDARATLGTLVAQGYTLALVSNIMRTPGATLRKLLERYGLLGRFAHTTFSDEVGVRKPDPEIFALTLRAVGGDPAFAVHVGDDEVLDVQGAHRAGMRAIQVTGLSRASLGASGPDAAIPRLAALPEAIERLES